MRHEDGTREVETTGLLAGHYVDGLGHTPDPAFCRCFEREEVRRYNAKVAAGQVHDGR